jgi:hypothetical protein
LDGDRGERHVVAPFGFAAGDTIEIVPVLPLTEADERALHTTAFSPCVRASGTGGPVLLLGFAPFYARSSTPNAEWQPRDDGCWTLVASKAIPADAPVTVKP